MIELEVVTPERHLLKVNCDSVTLPGALGEFEVLEGHTPVLSGLKAGILAYKANSEATRLMIAEGFAEVGPKRVTVLCEGAAFADEVDAETERALIEKLQKERSVLASDDAKEFKRVEAEIERSAAKLKLF
jgi:F-type H+-transporting ATPase subunit epsilon